MEKALLLIAIWVVELIIVVVSLLCGYSLIALIALTIPYYLTEAFLRDNKDKYL